MTTQAKPGFYGWRLLLALGTIYFLLVGFTFYSAPMLFPLMVADMGWDRAEVSIGFTAFVLTLGFAAPVCAWFLRALGARLTILLGGLLCVLGTFLMQFCTTPTLIVMFFGIITGLGMAMGTVLPIQSTIGFWFTRHRGKAMGMVLSGAALGGIVAPPVLTAIIHFTDMGWRVGWLACSLIMLSATVIAWFFIYNKPADLGQHPDGIDPEQNRGETERGNLRVSRIYRSAVDWKLRDVIRTSPFWFMAIASIASGFTWQVIVSQGPMHLADRGFSLAQISLIYGLTIGLSTIGRLGGGFLVDRIEPRLVYLGAMFCICTGSLLFWKISPENPVTMIYPLLSGMGMGAAALALPNLVGNYWGAGAFASVNGMLSPVTAIFSSISAPLAGMIFDKQGSYLMVMIGCWVLLGVGLVLVYFTRPPLPELNS